MIRLLVFLSLMVCTSSSAFAHSINSDKASIIEERHQLFILSILAYLHNQSEVYPKAGHDIAALLAWDVEDVDTVPQFVIDRNRNFEKQGNIFHAEIMTIEKAALQKFDFSHVHQEKQYSHRLTNTILYTSLEPCPFCAMGITVSRIPKVIYFMEDPGLRDSKTNEPLYSLPSEFLGKKLPEFVLSSLPLAQMVNQELMEISLQSPPGKYVKVLSSKETVLDFRLYFEEEFTKKIILGHSLFYSYRVIYNENQELYNKLMQAVDKKEQNHGQPS